MSTPQMGLGLISPDKMAELFETLGQIQTTLASQGTQLDEVHKAVYGNGEPSHDMRLESLEKQMTSRHALSAGIAGAVSLLYQLAVSALTSGHDKHGG